MRPAARDQGLRLALVLLAGASLAACGTLEPRYATRGSTPSVKPPTTAHRTYKTGEPYQVGGIWYVPHDQPHYDERGMASWYGDQFNMKATANGETFDMNAFSAAHTTLPLPSIVEVTNLDNGRKLQVRVNDRGPFVGDRIIDLSHAAARELGYDRQGLAHVRVRYVGPAPLAGPEAGMRVARAVTVPPPPVAVRPTDILPATPMILPPGDITVASLALPAARVGEGTPAAALFRIQAGAFSEQARAARAASQLSVAGEAVIEPIQRGGQTLYRVTLPAPSDEVGANALRDRIAAIGFSDARVLKPF